MPGMNTTAILARIADLKKQLETAISNVNALGGAIQDCEFWLGEAVKADEATKAINAGGRSTPASPLACAHDGPPG